MQRRRRPITLWAIGGSALLAAGAASAVVAVERRTAAPATSTPPTGPGTTGPGVTGPGVTGPGVTVLAPDQARISGTVTSAHLVGVVGPTIPLPVTITVPVRGRGRLTIDGVTVDGQPSAIGWDGGQPLPLAGTGGIDLGPATVDVDGGGMTWYLDGTARDLEPGQYLAGSDVAVGHAGLATPESRSAFAVAPGSQAILTSEGNARFRLGPRSVSVTGPATVTLTGAFAVETAAGTTSAHRVQFGPGPLELSLVPGAGGYRIEALLQGTLTAS